MPQDHPVSLAVLAWYRAGHGDVPLPLRHTRPPTTPGRLRPSSTSAPMIPWDLLKTQDRGWQGNGFLLSPSPTGHTDLCSLVPGAKGIFPPPAGTLGPPSPQRRVTGIGELAKGNPGKVLNSGKVEGLDTLGLGHGQEPPGVPRERAHTSETLNLCSLFAAWLPHPVPWASGPEEVFQG